MRFFAAILATVFLVTEARGRYGMYRGTESRYRGYDWSRYEDRTRDTEGRDWRSRFQMAHAEAMNHRGRLEDEMGGPADNANDPAEVKPSTEDQPRWGWKGDMGDTNWERKLADKKRYYQKKYGSFRWLPDASADRSNQQQRLNDTRQDVAENDGRRVEEGDYDRDHRRHHHRGPEHYRKHKKYHGRHHGHHHEHDRRHHEHEGRHHDHDSHHRHHGHDDSRHHGPPHGHHHRGHKGHSNSSGSDEDWSRSRISGGRSWHKGHHGWHRRHGDSSSSEENWSRSWDREDGSYEDSRKGKYDKKKERPSYNVTCVSRTGYEVRRYEESVWVTTLVNISSYEMAGRTGFRRLYRYISGHNNGSVRINMTKPVRKWMEVERKSEGRRNYTRNVMRSVSFFLPREFWDNPPEPLDGDVTLERFPAYDVFAYKFGGYAMEYKVKEKHRRFQHMLEMKEQPFSEGYFAVQGFDPPWIYWRRHNEILIPVDNERGTPSCPEEYPNGIRQCGDTECPVYTQLEELSDHIFSRQVADGVYATKKSTSCNISVAMNETYLPLHYYFRGNNSESISMSRTAPVLQLAVRPERTNSGCNFTFQTTFYIPQEYQESTPIPNDDSIFVTEVEPTTYYVIKFHETPTTKIVFKKFHELRSFLNERELCFYRGIFQLAFYDHPRSEGRHLYELSIPADETCLLSQVLEDFDVELFPQDEDGQIRVPLVNDDPNPVPYVLG